MDNYEEGSSFSSQNGDIFDSDDEKEREHSSEEESNSEENEKSEEDDSKEEREDGEHESSEDGENYDPWQTLIHEENCNFWINFKKTLNALIMRVLVRLKLRGNRFQNFFPNSQQHWKEFM
jgi:ABC-type Zn2+ transport system substrate-binding protein/surface adhesin